VAQWYGIPMRKIPKDKLHIPFALLCIFFRHQQYFVSAFVEDVPEAPPPQEQSRAQLAAQVESRQGQAPAVARRTPDTFVFQKQGIDAPVRPTLDIDTKLIKEILDCT